MNYNKLFPSILIHNCLPIFAIWLVAFDAVVGDFHLQILHNNDMHGRFMETSRTSGTCKQDPGQCFGGFARVAHVVRGARAAARATNETHVLFLNAGDTFTGTSWFSIHKWKIAAEFLNLLQPDCISLGNHEFDYGAEQLNPFLEHLKVPIVAANVDLKTEPLYTVTVPKSHIINIGGVEVGIIGYLLPDTRLLANTQNVTLTDEIAAITAESDRLTAQGVRIIIALGHSGFEMDMKIALEVANVDAVVGGHTNTFLYNGKPPDLENPQGPYPTVMTQRSGKRVPVVQAYAYTKYLGRLNMTFDDAGNLIAFEGQPILLKPDVEQEKDILDALIPFREEVEQVTKRTLGHSRVTMSNERCRMEECNFGNLVVDAYVDYMTRNHVGRNWTDCAVAIMNGGAVRSSIEPGDVLVGDILSALPLGGELYSFSLRGSDLRQTLETSIRSNGETSRGEFLQVSGLKVKYDVTKPVGRRVVSVDVRCANCTVPQYAPLKDGDIYRLITTSFILSGGDGYKVLNDKAFNKVRQDVDLPDLFYDYIERRQVVYPEISGRITVFRGVASKASLTLSINFIQVLLLQLLILVSSFKFY